MKLQKQNPYNGKHTLSRLVLNYNGTNNIVKKRFTLVTDLSVILGYIYVWKNNLQINGLLCLGSIFLVGFALFMTHLSQIDIFRRIRSEDKLNILLKELGINSKVKPCYSFAEASDCFLFIRTEEDKAIIMGKNAEDKWLFTIYENYIKNEDGTVSVSYDFVDSVYDEKDVEKRKRYNKIIKKVIG